MTTVPTATAGTVQGPGMRAPALDLRALTVAVGNEVDKGLRHAWGERIQILIELPLFVSFVLLFSLLLGQGEHVAATGHLSGGLDPQRTGWLFLGFFGFIFTYLQVVKVFWRLLGEIQAGTLEQTYLSPLPAWTHVAIGRITATIVETAVVVGVVYGVTRALVSLPFTWRAEALTPVAFLLAGAVGYSLIVAGLTLVLKRLQLVNDLVLGLMMLFSGSIVPLVAMPPWITDLARFLFLTHAVAALRTTMLSSSPVPMSGTGGLAWLAGTSLAWLAVGVVVFVVGEKVARRQGSLSRY